MLPKISFVIPTYNESRHLPLLLSDLSSVKGFSEIIVVDSESKDKTAEIAYIYGAKIYNSKKKNRGLQLNMGAKKAKGEWFFFIHADSRLNKDLLRQIKLMIKADKKFIYFFKFKINNRKIIYRFMELLVNLRSNFFKNPYGDQGLIIHREVYFNNRGYRKIPLMEDLDFIKRLNKTENLRMLNSSIYTSSRKWEKTNIIFQAYKNWNFRKRFLKGDSIRSIYNDYYKK